ncbi:sulfite exporter TauE/SafE family protein [Aquibacillus sp. 3ASR75-11]|uniref:Sulfite exporter TauE/SafE family protein n=1 Tax=Terrihalobacillus insolitus TaxID=2950438 RepID=A0A9X3WWS9_9BACI|nr:sulfite exporter TauE/SafE family protein [Terrihalobacillus insolitus]MDC3414796.1 sulfite exporter TauE/SafE family protein [Terrihalobacillus insolitus]MDC3425631.1 sulfite exporter TauE/SafE family protein [Terrihalobacillus insolitus]
MGEFLSDLSIQWYSFLTQMGVKVAEPIINITNQWNIPILTALLLGLAATTSPCQLTTNASALAFVSRDATNKKKTLIQMFAFIAGKTLIYTLVGGVAIYLGVQLTTVNGNTSILVMIRKIIGPIMILAGLYFLGFSRFRVSFGTRVSEWLKSKMPEGSPVGAFGFGIAFALAFCPTLVWLFFGLLIPLGIQTSGGILLPTVFALGTTVPLIVFVLILIDSTDIIKEKYFKKSKSFNRWMTKVAAIIFLLAGINDTFTYWFM